MGQVNSTLRRGHEGYLHWCPACDEMHHLPDKWKFNGNLEKPTFTPSFKHEGVQAYRVNGEWTGDWVLDEKGATVPFLCHYILTDGVLHFCSDSTHELAGKSVPLPKLPTPAV